MADPRKSALTQREDSLLSGIADALLEIKIAIEERVLLLELRLAALEQRKMMSYRGIWSPDDYYTEGDYATDNGSLWHANAATRSRPGRDLTWQLVCKNGRAR